MKAIAGFPRLRRGRMLLLPLYCYALQSQTTIDLQTQSRRADFSGASFTRPFKIGAALPASCITGEAFFLTSAPSGRNLYGCSATDVWAELSGGSSGVNSLSSPDSSISVAGAGGAITVALPKSVDASTHSAATTWTRTAASHGLGSTCDFGWAAYTVSGTTYTMTDGLSGYSCDQGNVTVSWPTATAGRLVLLKGAGSGGAGGGGTVSTVFGRSGAIAKAEGDYDLTDLGDVSAKKGNSTTVQMFGGGATATNDCAKFDANGNIISAGAACGAGGGGGTPGGSIGQAQFHSAGGALEGRTCGAGLDCSSGAFRVDPGTVAPIPLTATASLTFGSVAQSACAEQLITVTGAATGDAVSISAPAALEAGFVWSARVSSQNTVTVRLCKITTGAVSPVNATWRAVVHRISW
jgi:hypothetical protein